MAERRRAQTEEDMVAALDQIIAEVTEWRSVWSAKSGTSAWRLSQMMFFANGYGTDATRRRMFAEGEKRE